MSGTPLNLYESGRRLDPLEYSNGKTQTDVVEEILEAFESHDLVYLKAVVGSGKSAIGIRTALGMGGGVISVPTKVLSDQYYDDYYAGDKYFEKPSGERAKITVFKGRRNFICPLWKRKHPDWDDWMVSCRNRSVPCRKPLGPDEGRFDALEECPWAAYSRPAGKIPSRLPSAYRRRTFDAIGGKHAVLAKERGRSPERCPYWDQYWEVAKSDVLAMNSAKFKAETKIGRLPDVPLAVIDEGDAFLDALCPEVDLTQSRVERSVDLMRRNAGKEKEARRDTTEKVRVKLEGGSEKLKKWMAERKRRMESLQDAADEIEGCWSEFMAGGIKPLTLAERVWGVLGACGWETELRTQLRMIVYNRDQVSLRVDKNADDPGVTYHLPDPKPVLRRLLGNHDGKVLFMSSTKPSRGVLRSIFGIDPLVVEGEPEYPGTIVQKYTKEEKKVNYDRWQDQGFRSRFGRARDEILDLMERPAFVPCHGVKYLSQHIRDQDLTEKPYIEEDGVTYSTKMDRGSDLDEMRSVCLLKYPFPGLGDPLLQEMKDHLGEEKFWSYYHDIARRGFIQQVGRIMRSEDARKEFWSPDLTCHKKLQKYWQGDIETEGVIISA
ncbi:hypothetical protein AKJ41_00715 [candidate division MSBL1 archaeon SCGC-AAA259O05]|uniref:ATP-dependent helicase C-terminal domain-containing protein n=1 Tax=candidate division MSBL1 archaeon SCGC-AAA259O05 TaxID=1698271 RepID=A0A133V5C2_9EURY|nr:hypothetical protein AKJ41_00715 [candidate division MSBL1 archaeon SCGC-AAA259O05]